MEKAIYRGIKSVLPDGDFRVSWLVVPPMGSLEKQEELYIRYHHWVAKMGVDAVILHGATVGYQSSQAFMIKLAEQYGDIPLVNIGGALGDYPHIAIENNQGMDELMVHLLEEKGCQNFVYIRGPEGNEESEQRYQSYAKALKLKGINPQDQIELQGSFAPNFTRDMLNDWLPQVAGLPDAFVCCNDMAAKETIEALEGMGFTVPEDTYVTGFDDFEYAVAMPVPLTTVHQPLFDEGKQAAKKILAMLSGDPVQRSTYLPTKAVFRVSTNYDLYEEEEVEEAGYWPFIQMRDMQLARLQLTRQMMERGNPISNLKKSQLSLVDSGVKHLLLFHFSDDGALSLKLEIDQGLPVERNKGIPIDDIQKKHFDLFLLDEHEHWATYPLHDDKNLFGLVLIKSDLKEIEFAESFAEQLAVLFSNELLQRQAELINKQILQNEKMASLGGLVSGVAHEVNTPIGNCLLAATNVKNELVKIDKKIADKVLTKTDFDEFITLSRLSTEIVEHNLHRAAELINNFKQVAVDQTVEDKRELNLGKYLERVLSSLSLHAKGTNVKVEKDFDQNVMIETYPGAWAQIISNVFLNSLIHGFDDGSSKGRIKLVLRKKVREVVLSIEDNGKGMSDQTRDKIFDPFFTTRRGQGGTGLGMHIVYNICVQRLKGRIDIQSRLGKGSKFTIKVPS